MKPKRLTELESIVMSYVWAAPNIITVRQVYEAIQEQRKLAYTSVMTTMNRLVAKGVLGRKITGKTGFYAPLYGAEAMAKIAIDELVNTHFAGDWNSFEKYVSAGR